MIRAAARPPCGGRQGPARDGSDRSERSKRPRGRFARWWPWLKRLLTLAFFAAVGWLLFTQARSIDWSEVIGALRGYTAGTLIVAGGLAATSHLLYSTFDLLGRAWTGHPIPVRQVMPITFVSYAFNLNLGSLVGGFAFRYRLYSRFGLEGDVVTRVLAMSVASNWLGYLLLAGGVAAAGLITLPDSWKVGAGPLRAIGLVVVALVFAYVAACAFSRRRSWTLRGHELTLPPFRLALLQVGLSSANWLVMGAVLYVLFQQELAYPVVLGSLLAAAVAGAAVHVPAGLGVLEAVFIALLEGDLSRTRILAALLAYRAIYYLLPLLIAVAIYIGLELRARKRAATEST